MNTMNPQTNRNSRHTGSQQSRFFSLCTCTGFLILFLFCCLAVVTLQAQETATEDPADATTSPSEMQTPEETDTAAPAAFTKEIITGTSKRMESYEQQGITVLIDEAKTVRRNELGVEIGYLNADKITLKRDLETGMTKEIVAEGNVEIRDQDIFATCDHATMDNVTSTIILKENVVVLQNRDRLETVFFTFNRITGKQTAEGDVKFKVTVTQAAPVAEADSGEVDAESADEASGAGADAAVETDEAADAETGEETSGADDAVETDEDSESDTETPADAEENENPETDASDDDAGEGDSPGAESDEEASDGGADNAPAAESDTEAPADAEESGTPETDTSSTLEAEESEQD